MDQATSKATRTHPTAAVLLARQAGSHPLKLRDFFTPANTLTLTRLPLAVLMWLHPESTGWTLTLTALAGVSDLLDGRLARMERSGPHPAGVWLDPVCDKFFVLSALGAVSYARRPPRAFLLMVASREILQIPLASMLLLNSPGPPGEKMVNVRAAHIGKATTAVQFLAIGSLLIHRPRVSRALAVSAAILGPAAAAWYMARAFRDLQTSPADKIRPTATNRTPRRFASPPGRYLAAS